MQSAGKLLYKGVVVMEKEEITPEEAKEKHGISTFHNKMSNGELRFRLTKKDKTGYIRTEATNNSGWQDSHCHTRLLETYIVQSGRIIYAILKNNCAKYYEFSENQKFTTEPGVTHNVYLSENAVIHTVKHGDISTNKEERFEEVDSTKKLNKLTKDLTPNEMANIKFSKFKKSDGDSKIKYPAAYRHFDNLIWAFPALITAFFAFLLTKFPFNIGSELSFLGFSNANINSILHLVVGATFFLFGYTLFRFRYHQNPLKPYKVKKRIYYFLSPQIYLNLLINFQCSFFIWIGLAMFENSKYIKPQFVYLSVFLITPFLISSIYEFILFRLLFQKKGSLITS